jgi:hypothetical protein
MRLVSKLRPSPALLVALIALFVALGGTGYAATQLAKNSVGTKQLKKNAVISSKVKNSSLTGSDIKNSSLTGADIKNGSLTGSDLKLSSLGTVPSATNAAHATAADSASGVSTVSFHATKTVDAAANLASAPQIPLGSKGPFSFYGKCYVNGASVEATTYIASTSNTGMFDTEAEDSGYVTPSTVESSRKLQDVTTPAANSFDAGDGDKDFMATDGSTTIYGLVGLAAAKSGTPPEGDGPFGPGNRCMFGEVIFG